MSDVDSVACWTRHITEVAATVPPEQGRLPTRLDMLWLREGVAKVWRVGVIAPTPVLLADGIWTHLTRNGISVITPSPLIQTRCVDSAIRAAAGGRQLAVSEKLGIAKAELVRNGADVILGTGVVW